MAVILIIDDDMMKREMIEAHLEFAGYEVRIANNGLKGLEMATAQPPDLIMLDVRMPGISGYETCSRLRAQDVTRFIPVMMITGFDSDEDITQALTAGADDFIHTPFNALIALNRVKNLLHLKLLRDQLRQRDQQFETALRQHVDETTARAVLASISIKT